MIKVNNTNDMFHSSTAFNSVINLKKKVLKSLFQSKTANFKTRSLFGYTSSEQVYFIIV